MMAAWTCKRWEDLAAMVTVHDVHACAMSLPRTEEHLIRDHVKFRIGKIVYAAVSPDETIIGFAFPREERAALIAAEPGKFLLPRPSDQRYNWVDARMAAVDVAEMRELLTEAWRMVVPKRVAAAHLRQSPGLTPPHRARSTQ
jgi:hypothetical protein